MIIGLSFDLDTSLGTNNSTGWLLAKCFNYTPKLSHDPPRTNTEFLDPPVCYGMQQRKVDDSQRVASGARWSAQQHRQTGAGLIPAFV